MINPMLIPPSPPLEEPDPFEILLLPPGDDAGEPFGPF